MSQRWRPWSPFNQILGESHNIGMTINIKCQFKTTELLHLDHKLSANAVEPNDKKIRRITCFPVTDEKKGVQWLLGLVNYVVIFIPNFSEMTTLVPELLANVSWHCGNDNALKIKEVLVSKRYLIYYDVNKLVRMQVDASRSRIGAVLLQNGKLDSIALK